MTPPGSNTIGPVTTTRSFNGSCPRTPCDLRSTFTDTSGTALFWRRTRSGCTLRRFAGDSVVDLSDLRDQVREACNESKRGSEPSDRRHLTLAVLARLRT